MNGFERAIEKGIALFSPKLAAERAYFRDVMGMQERAYNSAKGGRRGDGWYAPSKSANAEIGIAAQRIRDRARDLVRNNPYAAGYPGLMAAKIIGAGIQPRLAMSGDENKAARERARGIWDRFCDNCDPEGLTDFYGLQSLGARAESESGEYLVRTIRLPASAKAKFPIQIVIQEGDFIDSGKTEQLENGNIVIQGIEFDKYGRRAAYWLYDQHPGDSGRNFLKRSPNSSRVDAADIDHVFERLRPGQVRGISPFAAVAMKMRDLDDYDDSELMRKKIAACFVAFRTRPAGAVPSPITPGAAPDSAGRTIEKLAPAMIKTLEAGEEITFGNPPAVDGYTEYAFGQLYAVAAGLGCTFEQLTGNLKGVNFSSIRVGENRFQDLLDHKQWHVYIPQMCKKTWDRVGQVARITGDLGANDPWTPRWITPRRRWLDPQTDVDATRDAVRSLQMSPLDAIALGGFDPEEVMDETAQFNKAADALGLVTDMDPRKVGRTSTPAVAGKTKDATAAAAA